MVLRRFLPGAKARSSTNDLDAPVVVRFAALGDVVLLTVLLDALHQRYGRPVHVLGSGPWTSVLLGSRPAVGEVRQLSSRRAPYWLTPSQQSAAVWLRNHRGPIYLCDPDKHAARLLQRAGAPGPAVPISLVGVAALAHSTVSVDTGPAHVAAAMDCPLVVLYGQFGWGRWLPRAPRATVIPLGSRLPTAGAKVADLLAPQVLATRQQLAPRP